MDSRAVPCSVLSMPEEARDVDDIRRVSMRLGIQLRMDHADFKFKNNTRGKGDIMVTSKDEISINFCIQKRDNSYQYQDSNSSGTGCVVSFRSRPSPFRFLSPSRSLLAARDIN